jgi:hypothetical protein
VRQFSVLLALFLAFGWGFEGRAWAEDETLDPASAEWDGLSDFIAIAQAELPGRVVSRSRLDYGELKREDGVLLVHPDASIDAESLARFMRDGGRVVLADDYGDGDELLAHFGIDRVALPAKPALMLRHNAALPLAEPASEHSVVWGVNRVVLNHASGLRHPELSPVLKVRAADGEDEVLVAVAGAVGQGRLLAIGDGSVFMNSMLRFPGNRSLATGVVRYAVEDDANGKRGGRLFIVSGHFEQSGIYGEEVGWEGSLRARMRSLLDVLSVVRREGLPPMAAFALAVLAGLGIILWVGSRAGRPHTPVVPRFVREIPLTAQGGLAGHTAVVAAPGTSRVLAMLEVKASLEDQLCELLGLDRNPGHDELLKEIDRRGVLDPADRSVLRALFLRLAQVETFVLARRGAALGRLHDSEVIDASRAARRIVQLARARVG